MFSLSNSEDLSFEAALLFALEEVVAPELSDNAPSRLICGIRLPEAFSLCNLDRAALSTLPNDRAPELALFASWAIVVLVTLLRAALVDFSVRGLAS